MTTTKKTCDECREEIHRNGWRIEVTFVWSQLATMPTPPDQFDYETSDKTRRASL